MLSGHPDLLTQLRGTGAMVDIVEDGLFAWAEDRNPYPLYPGL